MNAKDIRHQHLIENLSRFDTDEDFLADVNRRLAQQPGYKSGISPSYLSQLKNRDRNIGDKTARKLELGLGLELNSLDTARPHSELDAEFEALLTITTPAQQRNAINSIAEQVSPRTALQFAKVFLARVEAEL